MSNEDDIKERMKTVFPSPEIASRAADLLIANKKPEGWSKGSQAPYFKEIYARQVQKEVDRMLSGECKAIIYSYAKWCGPGSTMSTQTLYNRINQSIRYLCEYLDPNGKYRRWYDTVHITRPKGVGILIQSINGTGAEEFAAEVYVEENIPTWRKELDVWLDDSSKIEPFVKTGLILNPEEILQLKSEVAQLTNVIASITSSTIKYLKVNKGAK